MSTISQFPPNPLPPVGALRALFPPKVAVCERLTPGDPAELHPAERDDVANAVPKRIREFAAGRACARAALAELGRSGAVLRAGRDRQPLWPLGFVGSITHTAGFCAAAVASRAGFLALGLDTEVAGAPTPDIWPAICRDEELRWVESLPAAGRPAAVTLVFAAKEAFYKCQYPLVGEWLDFHDLRVSAGAPAPPGIFAVEAVRDIRFAGHVDLPLRGRYACHGPFVSAAIAVPVRTGQ